MSLYNHLLETRTKEELAKELVKTAKEKAELQTRVQILEHEVFWLKVPKE